MRFTMTVEMDSPAFHPLAGSELYDILHTAAVRARKGFTSMDVVDTDRVNVGHWEIGA